MASGFCFDYTVDRSGIGDYLAALNHALTACEWLGLAVLATPNRLHERTGSSTIYTYLGLDQISNSSIVGMRHPDDISPRKTSDNPALYRATLSDLYSFIDKHKSKPKCLEHLREYDSIQCTLDRGDYRNYKMFHETRELLGIPHKSSTLRRCILSSPAFLRCTNLAQELNKEVILIHVRRGDIATAEIDKLREGGLVIHDPKHNDKLIYALDGRLHSKTEILQSPHRYRHVSTGRYAKTLTEFLLSRNRDDYVIVLASDGYDRLISRITDSDDIKLNCSVADLEKHFMLELDKLTRLADISLVGEQESNLLETVSYIMMAKTIIHGPSSMAVTLRSNIVSTEPCTTLSIS